ncbi:MAG TPA: hypothetical protein VFS52_05880 [Steroidobacteraceae bacterium]|jgi:hypothetical protein|nr:hypothetical protein [Steroidobacteraceae bacterium]
MKKAVVLALVTLAAGCASNPPAVDRPSEAATPEAAAPAPTPSDDVQLLSAYPQTDYEDLGTFQYTFFRPGFLTPSLNTVMTELKDKVRQSGGNAFVVLDQSPDKADKRVLHVSAELLKVK